MLYNQTDMAAPGLERNKFAVLQEISNAMAITGNIDAIANIILDLAIDYTNAEKGSLMLLNEKGTLHIFAARGIDPQLVKTYRMQIGKGIAGTVAKERRPVLVEDIEKDERFKGESRDRYKTRSFISCPIVSKRTLLGVLNINDKKDGTLFNKDEFSLLKVISNQAAVALENSFLIDQLRANVDELENMNRRLIETDIVKTEFLTRVSHELRTPLNSIRGSIYYLRNTMKFSKRKQKEFYDIISDETNKLNHITENLLDFLSFEDETRIIKKSIINLSELLDAVLNSKLLNNKLEKKDIRLEKNIKEDISDIVGDKVWVNQFFINMLDGIIFHLERGDTISVEVKDNDSVQVDIAISRRLPEYGVPFLFKSKDIFKPDQNDDNIELYLARKIADVHGWGIDAKNVKDTFRIYISIPKSTRQMVDAAITNSMGMFVEFLSDLMGVNMCSLMLSDELTGELTIKGAIGLDEDIVKRTRLESGDKISGWVALEGKPLLIEDIERDSRFGRKNFRDYNSGSFLSLPLKIDGKVIGVLNLSNKKTPEPFTTQDLDLATVLCERIAGFIKRLYDEGHWEYNVSNFIAYFNALLDAEKRYHKKKKLIPDLMSAIMKKLEANEEDRKLALYVSMIYDLGLTLIDESILKKKKLLPLEVRTLKAHPLFTINLLDKFEFSEDVKAAILHHHERFDGSGYPDGLKGEEIPLISRVLGVVDSFCAMTSDRPYDNKMLSSSEALGELKKGSGVIYDPKVVRALEEII